MKTIKRIFSEYKVGAIDFEELVMLLGALVVAAVINFLNGRFGGRRLRRPLIYVWRLFAWATFAWVVVFKVLFPIISWWNGVVAFLNYVIWG